MIAFTFAYIPDPGKKQIPVGYTASLGARIRAHQKLVSPLMTVVATADANMYLSKKHGREVVLNGEAAALTTYEHNNAQWYRRRDLDALVLENKKTNVVKKTPTVVPELTSPSLSSYAEAHVEKVAALVKQGDTNAFAEIYQRYHTKLLFYIAGLVKNQAEAEEIVQDVLLKAHAAISTYQEGNFNGWIYRIARNTSFNHLRDRKRRAEIQERNAGEFAPAERKENALDGLFNEELSEAIQQALPLLTAEHREILELRYLGTELSCEEIGEALDIPLGTVLSRLHRARASLLAHAPTLADFLDLPEADPLSEGTTGYLLPEQGTSEETIARVEQALTDKERTAKFLPPDRTETSVSSAALLYHALTKYRVIRREVPEDVAKVEEALQYMTELQRGILDFYYAKNSVAWRIESRFGITHYHYLRERKAAEAIVRAVIDGTYQPAVVEEDVQDKKGEKTKTEKTKPTGALESRQKERQETEEADSKEYGEINKRREIRTKEDDLDLEKHIGNLGKELTGPTEDAENESLDVSLEQRCQKKHEEVQAFFRQMRRLPDLSAERDIYDLTAVIIGDSTIDFLIQSPAYPVASRYAKLLYARVKTHNGIDSEKHGIPVPSLWPLVTEAVYNPRLSEDKKAADHSHHFLQSYEVYAAGKKTPQALVALYKENLALLRGYVAVVGWHIGSNRTFRPDWEYRPHWKIAWQELAGFLKGEKEVEREEENQEERKVPLGLRATSFKDLVKDPAIKAALQRGYATMYHYSERARNIVVEQFTGLAISRAKKFLYLGMTLDDTVQEGRNGLFRATTRFDYTRLTKEGTPHHFVTYAHRWVDQMIKRAAQKERGVPVWVQEYVSNMDRIEAELMQAFGTKPSEAVLHEEFLARTRVSKATLKQIQKARLKMHPISLEVSTTNDPEGRTLLNTLKNTAVVAADEKVIDRQRAEIIEDLLKTLPKQERDVLMQRFWGNDGDGKTLEEVGREMGGLSRERIRQVEIIAIRRLRQTLRAKPILREEWEMDIAGKLLPKQIS